jgi:hypothetical protein
MRRLEFVRHMRGVRAAIAPGYAFLVQERERRPLGAPHLVNWSIQTFSWYKSALRIRDPQEISRCPVYWRALGNEARQNMPMNSLSEPAMLMPASRGSPAMPRYGKQIVALPVSPKRSLRITT